MVRVTRFLPCCEYLGVSGSGYYRYRGRKHLDRDREFKTEIQTLYEKRNRIYGYRRIQMELERQYGKRVNHKKVLRLMQEMNLRAIIRRPRQNGKHCVPVSGSRVAENLLQRNFTS